MERLKRAFAAILPGIFLLGFNIGTGSITTMAKAGAEYGTHLLWAVVLSCLITYRLITLYGRFALYSRETALSAFRRWIHPAVGLFFIVALTCNVIGSVMGVMGVIASITSLWMHQAWGVVVPPLLIAAVFSVSVYGVYWGGRTRSFEHVMAFLVAVMGGCFLLNALVTLPPASELLAGLIPSVPSAPGHSDLNPWLIIVSMVGTTVFSGLFIIRTTLVIEAGWDLKDLKKQERDAFVASVLMLIMSASVMFTAAHCFGKSEVAFESAAQMLGLLEPLAGAFAAGLFAIGIIAAGLSSQLPNILLFPWLWSDYHRMDRNRQTRFFRITVGLISLCGLVVPLTGARPILVMILSQSFGALLLPATVACLLYLGNRKDIMKAGRLSRFDNVFLWLVFGFSLVLGSLAVRSLLPILASFLNQN